MLITVSTVASAFSNDDPEMTVVSLKGSEVFKVIYKGNTSGKVTLNVLNHQGKIIHSGSVTGKDGFICPLNFKGLPSGNYTIELIDDHGSHQEKVVYVPAHDRKSIHITKLMNAEGKFLLAVANAQNEPIVIRIYDRYQRLLYAESRILNGDFAQVYRMEQALNHYTFEVSDSAGNRKSFVF